MSGGPATSLTAETTVIAETPPFTRSL